MHLAAAVFALPGLCFGISGIWTAKQPSHTSPPSPAAIQITQDGDRLIILKLWATDDGRRLEQLEYSVSGSGSRRARVRSTSEGTEIVLPEGGENWTISIHGELIIRRKNSTGILVLKPATKWVETRAEDASDEHRAPGPPAGIPGLTAGPNASRSSVGSQQQPPL